MIQPHDLEFENEELGENLHLPLNVRREPRNHCVKLNVAVVVGGRHRAIKSQPN